MSLLGTFEGRVDPQGRIVVPQRFREPLDFGVVFAKGVDGCVVAYPPAEWETVAERVKKFSPFDRNARTLQRATFSGAFKATLDRQGRTVLSPELRRFAGIAEEILFTGLDSYFEIWNPDRWAQEEALGANLAVIVQELEKGTPPGEKGSPLGERNA